MDDPEVIDHPDRGCRDSGDRASGAVEELPFEALFECAPDGLVVTDLSGRVQAVNQRAAELLGDEELIGWPLEHVVTTLDQGGVERALRTLSIRDAVVCDLSVELLTPQGRRPVSVRGSVCATPWGRVAIWALRAMPDAAAQHRMARASALKDAYLLALSHDLRSPIATLCGVAELLGEERHAQERDEKLIELMSEALTSVQAVVGNLLDLERLQHRGVSVRRRPTELADFVRRCVRRAGTHFPVHLDVPSATVALDVGLVERILSNLLANAERHAPGGAVTVTADVVDGAVTLTVADEGPGIPDDRKEEVFELFHQLEEGGDGSGVGLFLVRQFAVAHGGWSWFSDADDGGGAVAHVRLAT